MERQLEQLLEAGQSVWLDNLSRALIRSGELRKMIDQGLRGVTSNPTIFGKAIASGNDYDEQLSSLAGKEHDVEKIFWDFAIQDIEDALDLFRRDYDATGGADGFVSLEVSPLLAHDAQATIAMAEDLWQRIDRPNLMIKIPATPEGIPAIEECTAAGININVTLVFSLEMYEQAARAYIAGLQRRLDLGLRIEKIASANSLFISRADTAVDKLLQEKVDQGRLLQYLLGKAGIANAKLVYQKYLELFHGAKFDSLRSEGGRAQRPLWASTGPKNPRYPDLMYVEPLIGKDTINTMPPDTLKALLDHGTISPNTVLDGVNDAVATLEMVEQAGISFAAVTRRLQDEGVAKFSESFTALLKAISVKCDAMSNQPTGGCPIPP